SPVITLPTAPMTPQTVTNYIGMKFILIPAGMFAMGSGQGPVKLASRYGGEATWYEDEIQHQVTISRPFYMQTTEVTVGQWRKFVQAIGYRSAAEREGWSWAWNDTEKKWAKTGGAYWDSPGFNQTDDSPVTCVTWEDAQAFLRWLNGKEDEGTYRLPTEVEWEYAARAGSTMAFYFGDDQSLLGEYAWYIGNSGGRTHPVGQRRPNAWGLYDMYGNVWEWCQDWYAGYQLGNVTDPAGPSSGSSRVLRGGSWIDVVRLCRSASRFRNDPDVRGFNAGFRLVLTR
ncbi:MAG: formylglycine-generating enzyme family protein, partial [Pseudomonadota bacterium]